MDYWQKIEKNPYDDLYWNIPEQRRGSINVIGGNSGQFRTSVKVAEFLARAYPIKEVRTVLPDVLASKLPPVEGLVFLTSTESGSFADADELITTFREAEWNLLVGDLSKNSITERAVREAVARAARPVVVTRDTVDMLATPGVDMTLMNENLILMGSMVQITKIFRAAYYPKMLTLSAPITQIVEALHKFTLSYPTNIITLHNGQVLVAADGKVASVGIETTGYSSFMLWSGECAAKIVALNLYNPGKFVEATVAGLLAK